MVQVLEHAKEEKVSIRRLETVEEVLKEADVGSVFTAVAHLHALQHRLHVCSSLFCMSSCCLFCLATHLHVQMTCFQSAPILLKCAVLVLSSFNEFMCLLSQVVSLHCALTDETKHLINKERLSIMKSDAVLVNASRGPVIDETALVKHLQEKPNFR